jgi:FAD/FMN-containing dehydrogenase
MPEWINWSGSIRFHPQKIYEPTTEKEVIECIQFAQLKHLYIRPVGSSHSSSSIFESDNLLISLKKFSKLKQIDFNSKRAVIGAAMTIEEAGKALLEEGLGIHNQGDINKQTLIGGSSASTHGTGINLKIVADFLTGVKLINGKGELVEYNEDKNAETMKALRVSLGLLGVVTEVTLKLEPAFQLLRQEWCTDILTCMSHLEELIVSNRNFDFYWYPRNDQVKLRTWNIPGSEPPPPNFAKLVKEQVGPSYEMLSKDRQLKFEEMEYSIPYEFGPECFWEIRKKVKSFRKDVAWRVLFRTIAEDSNYLSLANNRKTVSISIHQNNTLPYEEYFTKVEPIFNAYQGRPHWGKKHTLKAETIKKLYPDWEKFMKIRKEFDPHNLFVSPPMKKLLFGDDDVS